MKTMELAGVIINGDLARGERAGTAAAGKTPFRAPSIYDKGSQYVSLTYTQRLQDAELPTTG
ncbi:hypothetical protein B9K09_20375 [Pseudomonas sp. M30-35]|nr:hypothetical protein B9K09_20375 [Pseudomonas sp. M30-35]